jgi:hypothetical protein
VVNFKRLLHVGRGGSGEDARRQLQAETANKQHAACINHQAATGSNRQRHQQAAGKDTQQPVAACISGKHLQQTHSKAAGSKQQAAISRQQASNSTT